MRWSEFQRLMQLTEKRGLLHPLEGEPPVVIENRLLDGFLDAFPDGCRGRDCERCRYCHRWAERAVRVSPQYRQECLRLYQRVFQDLLSA